MRRKNATLLAIGAGLSLMLGSGLLSVISDSVTSQGNTAESGTFSPPTHDVKAALIPIGGGCIDAEYSDGPLTASVTSAVDLDAGVAEGGRFELCVTNAGTETGRLIVSLTNLGQYEIGDCGPSELAAEGSVTCNAEDPGELASVSFGRFIPGSSPSACSIGSGFALSFDSGTGSLAANFAPGDVCALRLDVEVNTTASENDKLIAQTDGIGWDTVFTLQDAA